jgi:hypothetical protein
MSWNSIMGFIASVALFTPVFLIIALRLTRYRTFIALLTYYLFVFVYNIFTQGYIQANNETIRYWGIGNNLIDAPLMLFSLTYFSGSAILTKKMKGLILIVMLFELIVILIKGFTVLSITIILAPNLLIILAFCFYFFIRQVRISITHNKAVGKSLMVASLLFAYGCYSIIYVMYYIIKTPHVADTFLVYFLVVTFSSLLMGTGIIIERKRLRKLEEVMVARKELLAIYNENTPPTETIGRGSTVLIKSSGMEQE